MLGVIEFEGLRELNKSPCGAAIIVLQYRGMRPEEQDEQHKRLLQRPRLFAKELQDDFARLTNG